MIAYLACVEVGQVKGVLGELNTTSLVALHEEGIAVALLNARVSYKYSLYLNWRCCLSQANCRKFLSIHLFYFIFSGASGRAHTDGLPDEVVGVVVEVGCHFCCVMR
jgi:hypothetical protein